MCSTYATYEVIWSNKEEAGLGSIQFWNWNCGSIPIPELELVELKNGIGIENPGIGIENRN